MDITSIEAWLKTSIPGIILLGAIGSILAVLMVRLFQTLAPKASTWIKLTLISIIKFFAQKVATSAARSLARSVALANAHKIRSYYTETILRFCFYMFVMTWCLIFIIAAAIFPESPSLRTLALPFSFVFFICMGLALKTYCWLLIPHWLSLNIEEIEANAIKEFEQKVSPSE
jgi:hypothetical protein